MPGRPRLGREHMSHDAFAVNHERYSSWNYAKRFLHAIKLAHPAAFIAEQRKRKTILRCEPAVRFARIVADTYDVGAGRPEFLEVVAESASFDRAAAGVVFRIEIDHHVPAPILAQAYGVAVLVGQLKIG